MSFVAYQDELSPHHAVDRLPPELLIEVFVLCAHNPGDELMPLTLSRVSHYWRDVALGSPHVWQNLFLNDRRKIEASQAQTRLWLSRSAQLPLAIHLNLRTKDSVLPLLSPALSQIYRWKTCDIAVDETKEHIDFATVVAGALNVRLDHLHVAIKGSLGLESFIGHVHPVDENDPDRVVFLPVTPILADNVQRVFMRIRLLTLPSGAHMSFLPLTKLSISESIDVSTNASRMLDFLSALPMLEQFIFLAFPHEGNPKDDARQAPLVVLPHLQILVLRSTCIVRTILSRIDAPALRQLYLEHTNIDFEMRNDPYADVEEDGDSEDEAHDFSQSPWSDHATGVGLRQLIKRSNPPLEVLMMDYADMRTKDFQWCFDRLDHLKEFRIVASDMSNTVVNLLAPYRPIPSSCRPDAIDGSSEMRLRLPKLTLLGLWNCQRLSGDAIVKALSRRVRYADKLAGNEINTLRDVAIVGCQDFGVQHVLELSIVLGNRLRIS